MIYSKLILIFFLTWLTLVSVSRWIHSLAAKKIMSANLLILMELSCMKYISFLSQLFQVN